MRFTFTFMRLVFLHTTLVLLIATDVPVVWGAGRDLNRLLNTKRIQPKGSYYEAVVPDTLDLAQRAELAVNVLTESLNPKNHYAISTFAFGPEVTIQGSDSWDIVPKYLRSLPAMRTMSGSTQNIDVELALMRTMLSQMNEEGRLGYPGEGFNHPKGNSLPWFDGLAALAIINWYERDGNSEWLDWMGAICSGLKKSIIVVENRAYYPPETNLRPDGTWQYSLRGKPVYDYTPPDEPVFDQQGMEGSIKFEQCTSYRALTKYYVLTGDREALNVAKKNARFVLKAGMWEDTSDLGYPGHEHGMWAGHFHCNITNLHALLDLAVAQEDEWLKQFVREGYDQAIRNGVVRMGWFPMWTLPEKYRRNKEYHSESEGCGIGDMVVLAVKLTDAGLGDYWDDVDYIVRNRLAPQQFSELELMRQCSQQELSPEDEEILRRCLGGFSVSRIATAQPTVWSCCTGNETYALYYAWHGITRFKDGIATINLLLNRASEWMDIDSYLPYEGKVVLHNKKAHTALVRIPSWVSIENVKCYVNDEVVEAVQAERYVMVENLEPNDVITLTFPLTETSSSYFVHDKEYTATFRGSTVIDISPRIAKDDGRDEWYYPLYRWEHARENFKTNSTPTKSVKRFVAARLLSLQ